LLVCIPCPIFVIVVTLSSPYSLSLPPLLVSCSLCLVCW
jgi:hypothetical protein